MWNHIRIDERSRENNRERKNSAPKVSLGGNIPDGDACDRENKGRRFGAMVEEKKKNE